MSSNDAALPQGSPQPLPDELRREHEELRIRLAEAEDTLAAIRQGDVDALVVGSDIYTLDSSSAATNKLRQDVLAQMEDAVLAFDANDHLVFMNEAAERQYARSASDTLGRPKADIFEEIWPDGDISRQSAHNQLRKTGVYRGNMVHRARDGGDTQVEATVSMLRDSAGQEGGRLYVIRDISERIAAERSLAEATAQLHVTMDALVEADQKKDEFLATLAHELRNPLAPIRNALQIMRLSDKPEVQQDARNIIERQLGQMVHLVDDLLDVSRISQGKVELRLELADVASAVQVAVETSRPWIEAGKHELSVRLPLPQSVMVQADVTRLCQIVANLLNNAAKYTPDGGRIEVSAQRQGGMAVVTVKDSGVGIPPSMLPRVFDMFAQVDRHSERAQGGLGIGLALVKQLVTMHGGEVEARSDGAGRGSEFSVRLPLAEADSAAAVRIAAHRLEPGDERGVRVLVVDDNIDSALSMAQVLDMLGYETHTVHDGLEAVSAAKAFQPDVALLDIGLPHISGHEAARRIRELDGGKDVLLVALSGWGQEDDLRKSAAAGFDRHFVKPVDLHVLMGLVAQARRRG
ncbi:hybrid sensor histidine kinase/response regulator [Caenimonas aquaedulcis]|uniref:histidine kinase n=1 Tax=Caenimonas aquaedulcis TaxID=2793270 RepID=A0A931MJU6_9BURK|nr:ATP-binding protein [Caenimonas aquaedulcis]MBG9390695.1 response regulator [Caenimonas aquaedulcis]